MTAPDLRVEANQSQPKLILEFLAGPELAAQCAN